MEIITLNGIDVYYDLTFKNNKNTYFYFKKEGYIKINASKYQTKKQIINHMLKNSEQFLLKIQNSTSRNATNPNSYYLWGKEYKKVKSESTKKELLFTEDSVIEPNISVDQLEKLYKDFEKKQVLDVLSKLEDKYKNNPYVDISNITIKTRYTKTRFGSCNSVKRNINMNTHLVHYDTIYIEYVFLHEISHLRHQDHSKNFYSVLEKLCPNYKQIRSNLRKIYR